MANVEIEESIREIVRLRNNHFLISAKYQHVAVNVNLLFMYIAGGINNQYQININLFLSIHLWNRNYGLKWHENNNGMHALKQIKIKCLLKTKLK